MLKRLHISNFALINEMEVSFPGNLTVITGETGAGKSIFLEALSLALGKRADLSALNLKTKKCIIEAEFSAANLDLNDFFLEHDLDFEPNLILRREINADGKSRSFLNDSPVSLSVLKLLSEKLIDIHSQHQTLLLNQSNFQLELLDTFAESLKIFKEYKIEFNSFTKSKIELQSLQEQEKLAKKELDYFQFLYSELEETEIKAGILSGLEEESSKLENSEIIKSNLLAASNAISGNEINILIDLGKTKQSLQSLSKYSKNYSLLSDRIQSLYIELKELSADIEDAANEVVFDSDKLSQVNTKMDKLNRLLKKHQVNTEEDLLKIKSDIENKLNQFNSIEKTIISKQKLIQVSQNNCLKLSEELTKLRTKAIHGIEQTIKKTLAELSMENAIFKIELSQKSDIGINGLDELKFLFTANKGAELNELHKVASGGELSRLMLSLKALLASKKELPTIIFDEIDTGVSGDVADKIGEILLSMGNNMQVIAITHLPQMASKGNHHLFVYKKDDEDKTVSYIKQLNKAERINEIAKMLSKSNPTVSAIKNATELLSSN
jgi:DNA repair protein RecN (Recombination protein N)